MNTIKQQIGKLNHRIAFLTFITGRDDRGGVNKEWLVSNAIWAGVEFNFAGTDEDFTAGRLSPILNTTFTVRVRAGIQTYMRIKYAGDEYQIIGLMPRASKDYIDIKAELTEPEQRVRYWTAPNGQIWADPLGNAWEWKGDGDNEPDKKPYISPGGFTWTDSEGNTWFQNPSS